MKRVFGVLVLGIFLVSMMSGVLGADAEKVGEAIGEGAVGVAQLLKGFLAVLFDDAAFGEKEMLSRFFFAILLAMIVYTIVGSLMGDNPLVKWIATGAITALAIIAIPTNFLEAIRTQYGAMGATLLTIIPFAIIAFFTIKVENLLVATATWVVYSLYYFGLFGNKLYIGITTGASGFWAITFSPDVWPYLAAVIIGIMMASFGVSYARKWWTGGVVDAQVEEAEAKIRKGAAGLKAEAKRLESTTGIEQ